MMYKAKPKTEGPVSEKPEAETQVDSANAVVVPENESVKTDTKSKRAKRERKPKKSESAEQTPEGEGPVNNENDQTAVNTIVEPKQEEVIAPKSEKVKKERAPKSKNAQSSNNESISNDVLALQQLLIQKEKEIGSLNLIFDKQDTQIKNLNKENEQMKEQLTLSNDENQLKQTI